MQNVSSINFYGKFNYNKLKSKQAIRLKEILNTEYNGISNIQLLETMPFDVDVICLNPSKKAINPKFNFRIKHSKGQATLQGSICIKSKNSIQENIKKLNEFINNFNKKYQSLSGNEKLTRAEELRRQVNYIIFGKII